jgi:hypothetical protein
MLRGDDGQAQLLDNRVTRLITRYRKPLLAVVLLLYVVGFNGRWRVGLDSANYRGLAINLASGNGYAFGNWAPHQVYPGFPLMLAGVEKLLGPTDRTPSLAEQQRLLGPSPATTASVLLVIACAMATLWFVYRLIRLHYATWIAVTITCGVGSNAVFLQQSNELMTDVPFLLGMVMALYGWDLLQRAATRRATLNAAAVLVPGLIIAATTRPMFWVLAAAWIAVCVWGLITGPRRRFYAICLGALLLVWGGFILVDPRSRGIHLGGYEREALDLAPRFLHTAGKQILDILRNHFPPSVFGEHLAPCSVAGSLVVLASVLMLWRRHAMWVLLVYGTFLVTLALSAEARYYMMVLPVMLLGWLTLFCWIARKLPRLWGEVVLVVALSLVTLNNLSASVSFFVEQHRGDFIRHYKDGDYLSLLPMAEQIRQKLPMDATILGPSGSILSLLTGRHVYDQRELLPRGPDASSPAKIAAANLQYVIVPAGLYLKKEPAISRMITKRIIGAAGTVAQTKQMRLGRMVVHPPPTDWRRWKPPKRPKRRAKKPGGTAKPAPATAPSTATGRGR